ncbi:hypothetical protein SAMN05421743_11472 [Thalassobacillus cyri]|uniref:Uncharacterized protein n=1 Tax=Thalassobacillus cyri TaxID=571932 RepID=A0A1H4GA36_9BACI|nr:hypothetical protein [Thalassobacillus cyri]SEB05562.1 hypothetical protein SAMN05421743_11472 [Thalassobacillus cyri]
MKKIEWFIILLLIGTGLMCLTLSATTMWAAESSGEAYLKTFLQLCLWMGIPLVIVGFVYFVLLKKRKDK